MNEYLRPKSEAVQRRPMLELLMKSFMPGVRRLVCDSRITTAMIGDDDGGGGVS